MSETSPADLDVATTGPPLSCYLLEFSVGPGGARMADVYVGATLDALRETCQARWTDYDFGCYLIISYGALLHLWVVQEGEIVEGIDLHPYLRTGDERCDRTLTRVLEIRGEGGDRWEEVGDILDTYEFYSAAALPLLARMFELQDRLAADPADAGAREELDGTLAAVGEGTAPASCNGMTVECLHLDWAAIATLVPPLREPILTSGQVGVRWADPAQRHPKTHLHGWVEPTEPHVLDLGVNDLES